MIYYYNYEQCEDMVRKILQKMPVLRTKQLTRIIHKISKKVGSYEAGLNVLRRIQSRGHIYLSEDGWALSRGAATRALEDDHLMNVDTHDLFALGPIHDGLQREGLINDAIDCFWACIDFMPQSIEFISNLTPPWSLCFNVVGNDNVSRLYQILKVKKGDEFIYADMLRSLPQVDEESKKNIIRIAFVEDMAAVRKLPKVGIKYFCIADEKLGRGYKIVAKREGEDVWEN